MGTEFAITAYGEDPARLQAACDAALARIAELDGRLSNFRSDSELSRLSHAAPLARGTPVSDDLWCVLRAGDEVSRRSGGAFDVTVGPLTKLWRNARRVNQWPGEQRWQQARAAVGYRHIEYDIAAQAVRLTQPHMLLDLGGIAKGYALDEALETMRDHGVPCALIDGGGDVVAGQAPPGKAGWRIGVASLGPDDTVPEVEIEIERWLDVEHVAVATSGDRWQFVEFNGRRYSHLIDPRTGEPLRERSSVTVIAPTGMLADAWASALSVLDPEAGSAVLAELKSIEARRVRRRDGQIERHETAGFARREAKGADSP
jgi:thiamine biosynthesis lipoprotein